MNRLIENLLSLAKIDAGHLSLDVKPCDANDLVNVALDLITPLAVKKSIHIQKSLMDVKPSWTVIKPR